GVLQRSGSESTRNSGCSALIPATTRSCSRSCRTTGASSPSAPPYCRAIVVALAARSSESHSHSCCEPVMLPAAAMMRGWRLGRPSVRRSATTASTSAAPTVNSCAESVQLASLQTTRAVVGSLLGRYRDAHVQEEQQFAEVMDRALCQLKLQVETVW